MGQIFILNSGHVFFIVIIKVKINLVLRLANRCWYPALCKRQYSIASFFWIGKLSQISRSGKERQLIFVPSANISKSVFCEACSRLKVVYLQLLYMCMLTLYKTVLTQYGRAAKPPRVATFILLPVLFVSTWSNIAAYFHCWLVTTSISRIVCPENLCSSSCKLEVVLFEFWPTFLSGKVSFILWEWTAQL